MHKLTFTADSGYFCPQIKLKTKRKNMSFIQLMRGVVALELQF